MPENQAAIQAARGVDLSGADFLVDDLAVDGLAAAGFTDWVPALFTQLPLADQSMGWLVPVLVMLVFAVVTDRLLSRAEQAQHHA